ncbi:MAG: TerS protein [Phenylobacterium zucineum]|nr:MAG: TerS protein [Phenylobacterium zucineum]
MATRKTRTDSASGAVKAMINAAKPTHVAPVHCKMREKDAPFWAGVILSRAHDEWTQADLVVAAQLARTQADLEDQQELLDSEGTVVENARGTQIMNPRVTVLEGLARREMALMRTLRMGGKPAGDARDMGNTRKLEAQSRKLREELEDDPLLA